MAFPSALLLSVALVLGAAEPRELRVDLVRDGAITAATLAASALVSATRDELTPSGCRWCAENRLDGWARDRLRWGDPEAGRLASNIAVVAVPAGLAGALALSSGLDGPRRRMLEDFVLVAQAFGVTMLGDHVPKLLVARLRPYALYDTAPSDSAGDRLSFWSGHTAVTFAAASAAGTVARLRGYEHWRWIMGVGFAGAAATGWFRVAGDRHWLSDVVAGAAWGTAVGVAVPLLHTRTRRASIVPVGSAVLLVVPL